MLGRVARGLRGVVWGLAVVYPLALYWALTRHGAYVAAGVAAGSGVLWGLRAALAPRGSGALWGLPLVVFILSALTLVTDDARLLLALPVLINLALLVVFGGSLRSGPSYVERVARLVDPDLTPAKVQHCRQFTWVWVGFFVCNGAVIAALALADRRAAWAVYSSGVSYALIGGLLLLEWVVRRWRFGGGRAARGDVEGVTR
ncbi:MAG: hypothetical protein GX607_13220 [Myxococcales bacterium]|nr:hypothetical protein [Myxococcales bacterium]